jgi:hypothetical protein
VSSSGKTNDWAGLVLLFVETSKHKETITTIRNGFSIINVKELLLQINYSLDISTKVIQLAQI